MKYKYIFSICKRPLNIDCNTKKKNEQTNKQFFGSIAKEMCDEKKTQMNQPYNFDSMKCSNYRSATLIREK